MKSTDLQITSETFMDIAETEGLVAGEWYGLRIFALDESGKVLSASSQHEYVEFFVK